MDSSSEDESSAEDEDDTMRMIHSRKTTEEVAQGLKVSRPHSSPIAEISCILTS
ncbi:hypothetical protein R6Q59_031728 [Mikania micrantha]